MTYTGMAVAHSRDAMATRTRPLPFTSFAAHALVLWVLALLVAALLALAAATRFVQAAPGAAAPLVTHSEETKKAQEPPVSTTSTGRTDSTAKTVVRYTTLIAVPAFVFAYGQQIWDWGNTPGWRWANEGYFGLDTPHGGADKLGHAFGMYTLARVSSQIFNYTEGQGSRRLVYAASMAGAIGLGIEVGDAFNGAYGFSFHDLGADLTGLGLGMLLESVPALDGLLGFSVEYFPTRGFRESGDSWLRFESDTGGFKYMLNLRPSGLPRLGLPVPLALQLFTLDFGYYTRGFTRYERNMGVVRKDRALFAGASINLAEALDVVLFHRGGLPMRAVRDAFRYYHVPLGLTWPMGFD